VNGSPPGVASAAGHRWRTGTEHNRGTYLHLLDDLRVQRFQWGTHSAQGRLLLMQQHEQPLSEQHITSSPQVSKNDASLHAVPHVAACMHSAMLQMLQECQALPAPPKHGTQRIARLVACKRGADLLQHKLSSTPELGVHLIRLHILPLFYSLQGRTHRSLILEEQLHQAVRLLEFILYELGCDAVAVVPATSKLPIKHSHMLRTGYRTF
jgi:hypothetical protein